ncbi:MAG: ComE operon protein 3 [Thermoanaerobacterales bacterium 50_218]|nr:MAG: ComE operon protein 3 [Thermoanaerobacterales bacterium 50_218]HAA89630.1 DNA internalization-related competence protein ComEC/Rec2 [Peptococcaceae bacterium]
MSPVVLLVLAFAGGILLFFSSGFQSPGWGLVAGIVFLSLAGVCYWRGKRETPLFLFLSFVALGFGWMSLHQVSFPPALEEFLNHRVWVKGVVKSSPVAYSNKIVFDLGNPSIEMGGKTWKGTASFRVICYLDPERQSERQELLSLLPGDLVGLEGDFELPSAVLNPGAFDYREYLARKGICALLKTSQPPQLLVSGGSSQFFLKRFFAGLRFQVRKGIRNILPGSEGAFLEGILLGAKEGISAEDKEVFRKTGVMHLFAVSGLHLGFVLLFFLSLARRLHLGRFTTFLLTGFGVFSYAAVVGFPPSVLRAMIMGMLGTAAYLWRLQKNAFNALALAAFGILIIDPQALFDPGFQLSFAATWGIIYLAPPLGQRIHLPPGWREVVSIPLAAQLAVFPLTAHYFQLVPLLGLVANIIVVFLAGVLVNLGLLGIILTVFHHLLGEPFFLVAGVLSLVLQKILALIAGIPGCFLLTAAPSWPLITCWYLLLLLFGWGIREGTKVEFSHFTFSSPACRWVLPSLLGLGLLASAFVFGTPFQGRVLRVTFLSVGQGDSILIETPHGSKMLVDGGGKLEFSNSSFDPGQEIVVPYLLRRGIRSLDLVVNSHPHEDHLGGLLAVMENLKVKAVAAPPLRHPTPLWLRWEALIEEKEVPCYLLHAGDFLRIDPDLEVVALHPPSSLLKGTTSDVNNNSLVLHLRYGRVSFLLPGDLEREGITYLTGLCSENSSLRKTLQATVLKAPHHGSSTSFTPEFAAVVNPRFVVISVGSNPFGHPAPETVNFWRERGVQLLRTDEDGAVIFETDGEKLFLRTTSHRS